VWTPLEIVLLIVATGQSAAIVVLALALRDVARGRRPPEPLPPSPRRPAGFRLPNG